MDVNGKWNVVDGRNRFCEYSGCCCEDGRVKPHVNVTKPVLNLPKPDMARTTFDDLGATKILVGWFMDYATQISIAQCRNSLIKQDSTRWDRRFGRLLTWILFVYFYRVRQEKLHCLVMKVEPNRGYVCMVSEGHRQHYGYTANCIFILHFTYIDIIQIVVYIYIYIYIYIYTDMLYNFNWKLYSVFT